MEPAGNARAEWMSFPGGEGAQLSPDGTAVPGEVSVPPGTPPGSYGFGLVVTNVANPDEHYDRGPSVAFIVVAAPVAEEAIPLVDRRARGRGAHHRGRRGGHPARAAGRGPGSAGLREEGPKCGKDLTCGTGNVCLGDKGFKGCERGAPVRQWPLRDGDV